MQHAHVMRALQRSTLDLRRHQHKYPCRPQVAAQIDGGRTALFAFRGTFQISDWGTNTEARLAVLGTAADLFPCDAIDSGARLHAGFLARFRDTLGAGGLADQVRMPPRANPAAAALSLARMRLPSALTAGTISLQQ